MRLEVFREAREYARAAGPLLNADTLAHNALIDELHFRPAGAVYYCAMADGAPLLAAQAVPGRPLLLCAAGDAGAEGPSFDTGASSAALSPAASATLSPAASGPLSDALEALARALMPGPPSEAQGPPGIMAGLCRHLPGAWALRKRLTLFRADAGSMGPPAGGQGVPDAPGASAGVAISATPAVPGALVRAAEPDMAFLPEWDYAMATESGMAAPRTAAHVAMGVRGQVADGRIYLWVNGVPCAMAVHARDAGDTAIITTVYTAAAFRRMGFGHACVAGLTRLLLGRGYAACALYADAENPVSNRLYRAVGYRAYAQVEHWAGGYSR